MEEERLKAILESLLFAAGEPVPLARLAAVLDNVARDAIKKALSEMLLGYGADDEETDRGTRWLATHSGPTSSCSTLVRNAGDFPS